MALTKREEIGQVTVLPRGQIMIRYDTVVAEDDTDLARTYRRVSLHPGDDVSTFPPRVQAIAGAVWTPALVAAWRTFVSQQRVLGG